MEQKSSLFYLKSQFCVEFYLKFNNCLCLHIVQLIQDVQCSQAMPMYSWLLKIGKVLLHLKIFHPWGSNSIEFAGLKGGAWWRNIYLPGPWEMAGYWPADVHLQCWVGPVRNIIIINTALSSHSQAHTTSQAESQTTQDWAETKISCISYF